MTVPALARMAARFVCVGRRRGRAMSAPGICSKLQMKHRLVSCYRHRERSV